MKLISGTLKSPYLWNSLLGGAFNAGLWDAKNVMTENKGWRAIPFLGTGADILEGKMSQDRAHNTFLNSVIGMGAGAAGRGARDAFSKGNTGVGATLASLGLTGFFATPTKDMMQTITHAVDKNRETPMELVKQLKEQSGKLGKSNKIQNWLLGGALGLGGAGLLYSMLKKDKPEKAKMHVKLPGDPNDPDSDVTVEVPVSAGGIKPEILRGIRRSIRKQTARNVISQQRKRDPRTGKLIPYMEWKKKYGDELQDMNKAASGREWAEGLGSLLAPAIGAAAASYGAHKYTGGDLKKTIAAGAGAALLPALLGSLFGSAMHRNTPEQQAEHDAGPALLEYIVPGYAQFQSARRSRTASSSEDDELDTDDDLDYEDELDKYAAQAPMPPQGGAPMPPPSPVPPAPAPGMVGTRPERLSGSNNVTAGMDRRPRTSNSANKLRKAADNLKSWLAQYGTRMG